MSNEPSGAFLSQIDQHKAILYKIANAYCAQREDRSDLIQDIVLELWRAWPRYDGRAAVSTWMYRIASNVAISALRSDARRIRNTLPLEHFGLDLAAADRVLDEDSEDLRTLQLWISRLEPVNRTLILMYLEGYRQNEIADALGISASNVATRINRIKLRLQREHAAQENEL